VKCKCKNITESCSECDTTMDKMTDEEIKKNVIRFYEKYFSLGGKE